MAANKNIDTTTTATGISITTALPRKNAASNSSTKKKSEAMDQKSSLPSPTLLRAGADVGRQMKISLQEGKRVADKKQHRKKAAKTTTKKQQQQRGAPTVTTIENVPSYLQEKYVYSGYRINYNMKQCLQSIFHIHNETGNIWTSLLSLALFLGLLAYTLFFSWRADNTLLPRALGFGDVVVFALYFAAGSYCFLTSAMYHIFLSHRSQAVFDRFVQLDYSGITTMIAGSFFAPIYYAFGCMPTFGYIYMAAISLFGLTCIYMFTIRPARAQTESFKWLRTIVFCSMAAFGIIPIIHILAYYRFDEPVINAQLISICKMYGTYALGVFFYMSRIPESLIKGRFDYIFHSHQLWHVCVTAAAVVHAFGCYNLFLSHPQIAC